MEKLQAAIEKARQQRGDAPQTAAPRAAQQPQPQPAATGPEGQWAALRPVELNRAHLLQSRIMSESASAESTPFDVLRTKILYHMRQNGWKRLAITSPLPQCGKSTTACNLALGMGRQPELRSMLFDFDLRTPTIAEKMGIVDAPPLTPMLSGQRDFSDHAVCYGGNLALALSGQPDLDPTRMLMADSTKATLATIQDRYQPNIMIFDLPSILIGDDARAFLQHVDCALILARAEQTRFGDFDSCEREVGEYTNVLGVVLNAYRHGDGLADLVENQS